MKLQNARKNLALVRIVTLAILAVVLIIIAVANSHASPARRAPDAVSSRAAFLQIYKVFTSPRCQNCHPSGDSPLQGDDSHPHLQNVKRGKDGHGVYGMRWWDPLESTCRHASLSIL